jgi:hypothetical protein
MSALVCRNEKRRSKVRESQKLAGFDYLEVGEDHLTLRVYLLGSVPPTPLKAENFRVEGGRRVRGIQVREVFLKQFDDPELDDYVEVVVDRFGDFSTYTLKAVAVVRDERGVSKVIPHPDFDSAYNQLDFTFTASCTTPLDCTQEESCPPPIRVQPTINYLAKDYASFRQLIYDRLALVMPDWKNRFVPDVGVTLVELLAYTGDYLSYFQDAVATEAYLATARQRISVRRHARLVDYRLHEGCNARAFLVVGVSGDVLVEPGQIQFITAPVKNLAVELTRRALEKSSPGSYVVFEAIEPTQLYEGQEAISFYTWENSECCLAAGATSATLIDDWVGTGNRRTRKLKLKAGDFMVFEEVLGPKTGLAADADPTHRWVVRLTDVVPDTDPLSDAPVLTIEWAKEDALPFPLCLSSLGLPPDCQLIENVSVAHGNVVLADHGATTTEPPLPPVEVVTRGTCCVGEGLPEDVTPIRAKYRPRLAGTNLTFREPLPAKTPASRALRQDPHTALPAMALSSDWQAVGDLIESRSTDKHFVVEMDNERVAWLRFGDGTHGALPPVGGALSPQYRVGSGTAGNVGREAIVHVLTSSKVSGLFTSVRNPLPAQGGAEPEETGAAKMFAPQAFRTRLERAITAEDYAAIAQREFPDEVERAAATLRWNGSWYEALVAIDAFGTEQASPDLVARVWRKLYGYRRIGHDLRVEAATRVPVLIVLAVCVKSSFLRAHVLADLQAEFGTGILPDGRPGFFQPDNLSFGGGLFLSQVVSRAQEVGGVLSVSVPRFERMFEGDHGEIAAGLISFGPFEIAQCDSDPSFPENGQIQFQIGGGR